MILYTNGIFCFFVAGKHVFYLMLFKGNTLAIKSEYIIINVSKTKFQFIFYQYKL